MAKNIKSVGVLVAICTVVALLLALTNQITAPIIEKNAAAAANAALLEVMPEGTSFELVDLSTYTLPDTVTEVYKETSGKGYVIKLNAKGFKPDMIIMCGVSSNGIITGAVCLESGETYGVQNTYGQNFIGKDAAGVEAVDTVSSPTAPLTTTGYKGAVKDALNAVLILGGADVDIRTPEQILQDNLAEALPAGEGEFTKLFFTEVVEGVDAVYAADNGAGYVAVIGEEFVTTDAEGNSDNAVVAAAVKTIRDSSSEDILAAFQEKMNGIIAITTDSLQQDEYAAIKNNVLALNKTASGNYDITINGLGFGYYGDKANYQPGKKIPIVIRVSITPDGKIIDTLTVSHSESNGWGAVCGEESYYGQFDGKTTESYKEVDAISGATKTTDGYMKAISRCFTIVDILEGGAQ